MSDNIEKENCNRKNKSNKEEYIKKYHLYYLLAIATIIIILLTSFIFKSSEYAGAMLTFAATLSSILLAIIAIIITLLDVSGQKQNVYDMKKEIEKLTRIVNQSSSFSEELEVGLSKIEKSYTENTKLLTSLHELVIESKQSDKPEEFYQKAQDLINKNVSLVDLNNLSHLKRTKEFKIATKEVLDFISRNPGKKLNEVNEHFKGNAPLNYQFIYREALNNILFNKEVRVDENGGLKIQF